MEKINGIENALLLDLEEARELIEDGVRLVVLEGCIRRQYSDAPLPVHGCELWYVGNMDGMPLCVTAEVWAELQQSLSRSSSRQKELSALSGA